MVFTMGVLSGVVIGGVSRETVLLLLYVFILSGEALIVSVAVSLLVLFALGGVSAILFGGSIWREGFEMLVLRGMTVIMGYVVGSAFGL